MLRTLVLAGFAISAFGQPLPPNADLSQVQSVYLLKMRAGFDQYLANHLTSGGFYRVVTDPAKADAIFTDRVGKAFEEQMEELYPPPPPPAKAKSEDEEEQPNQQMDIRGGNRPKSNLGSASNTIFLVDRRSRQVVWSTFAKPKTASPTDLNALAKDVVGRLQVSLQGKK